MKAVVCLDAALPRAMTRGSTRERCASCRLAVLVAPSTQQLLVVGAAGRVLCLACFRATADEEHALGLAAGSVEAVLREASDLVPNPWHIPKWGERN